MNAIDRAEQAGSDAALRDFSYQSSDGYARGIQVHHGKARQAFKDAYNAEYRNARLESFAGVDAPAGYFPGCGW